ncbi:hybrid sensor histidine kinase/response regulator [Paenibacillus taiwanensis]|uniref:hybrid sensor histidine kinase/response regulator n=1 Tax=Paenibacillus taiwanensis TaxID=401638 RepID=UPI00042163EC|nr:ATP-binding protein [Paenibacillus taiwanensis]
MRLNRKLLIWAALFLLALTGLRFLWLSAQTVSEQPHAVQGVLDLRNWDLSNNKAISLKGEWEFYPGQLLQHAPTGKAAEQKPYRYLHVPGTWNNALPESEQSAKGFGTYRLRILTGAALNQPYGLWVHNIQSASEIELNGQKIGAFGIVSSEKDQYKPVAKSYTSSYIAEDQRELELIVRVANYDNPVKGGIVESIKFGSQAAIDNERLYAVGFQLIIFVVLLLHGLYAGIMYYFNRQQKSLIPFFLLLACAALAIAADDDKLLLIWLPINYTWGIKLALLSYIGTSVFMLELTKSLLSEHRLGHSFRWLYSCAGVYACYLILAHIQSVIYSKFIFTCLCLISIVLMLVLFVRSLLKKNQDAVYLLFAAASITSSALWGIAESLGWVEMTFYPWDIFAAIIGFSAFWFKQFYRHAEQNAQMTEQLKRADKLKDEFLANTSHELRTPLHGIMNIAQTIVANESDTIQQKSVHDLELLITISRRMSYMINDLLDLTQLQEKRIQLQPVDVRIPSVVSGVIDMLHFMTDGKSLDIKMDISPYFPRIWADEKRFVQIMFNLLHNAIKFTETGTISITAYTKQRYAYISVADTGIGMDRELQARAFKPYEQGGAGINAGGGIGLGLNICKQLVELHDGNIYLQSVPSEGSTFTFTMPLSPHAVDFDDAELEWLNRKAEPTTFEELAVDVEKHTPLQNMLSDSACGVHTSKAQILVIDDDAVNLKVLCNILASEPYEITKALSGREALALLHTKQWDLIVADVMMPHMSGYEFTRCVRTRFSVADLPILLLTARSQAEDVYSGFMSGANDYVTKPVDALELKYRVKALITLKQSVSDRLRMEAAYLQAQIRPHFLFNSLNSIMALSEINTTKMHKLIEAFSDYLRISFNFWNSEQLVPLEHELNLVRAYLYIEKERFDERLHIVWEVNSDVALQLPPLTIQPLVENAVKHGILSRFKGGTVHIRIMDVGNHVTFTIQDDGIGMDEATVSKVLDSDRSNKKGIGLYNTDRRLKQLYGQGLSIQSELEVGTTLSFVIPRNS